MEIRIVGASEEQARVLRGRAKFVAAYCASRGWDPSDLTVEQVLEIRRQPGWMDPRGEA